MIVTIDGPAGSGKSTIAKEVAKRLNYFYCDSGAMYRSLAFYLIEKGLEDQKESVIQEAFSEFHYTSEYDKGVCKHFVNQQEITGLIRSLEVSKIASKIATLSSVRELLVDLQRACARQYIEKEQSLKGVVFEGRDMGSFVFPQAECKIYLTASLEVRAKRRLLELKDQKEISLETLKEIIKKRDQQDMEREHSPLIQAKDAAVIDTSYLSLEEVIEAVLNTVSDKTEVK